MLTDEYKKFYDDNGYVVVRGLFNAEEVAFYREHYMRLRKHGKQPGDYPDLDLTNVDPLKRFPRMIQMHHWDETSMQWMLNDRINACLTGLLGREPFAVQTMLYFKPPTSRGQALHQDNFYLKVEGGTCMAAWMALDVCDEDSGCLQIVPGSHEWPLLCTTEADTKVSFTDITVPLPPGQEVRPVLMEPGDVMFFHGSLIHGSFPNTTTDRFRRALIGHYVEGTAEKLGKWYRPMYRMDGTIVDIEENPGGGPCGVWVEADGSPVIELVGEETVRRKHE